MTDTGTPDLKKAILDHFGQDYIPFLKVGRKVIYDWILITEWLEGSTSAQADQGVRNQRADGSELP